MILAVVMMILSLPVLPIGAVNSNADLWDGSADISWHNTTDTEFVLDTAEELAGLAKLVNEGTDNFDGKTVKLGADIALNSGAYTEWGTSAPANEWIPIGRYYNKTFYSFMGTFDGCGHTISGMYINSNNTADKSLRTALFGCVGGGVVIKSLIVTDSYVAASSDNGNGIIIGQHEKQKPTLLFEDITVERFILNAAENKQGVGVMIGRTGSASEGITFNRCAISGIIENANGRTGGFIGYQPGGTMPVLNVTDSLADLVISGSASSADGVGMILGYTDKQIAVNVTNTEVHGRIDVGCNSAGAMVGVLDKVAESTITVKNSISDADVKAAVYAAGIIALIPDSNLVITLEDTALFGTASTQSGDGAAVLGWGGVDYAEINKHTSVNVYNATGLNPGVYVSATALGTVDVTDSLSTFVSGIDTSVWTVSGDKLSLTPCERFEDVAAVGGSLDNDLSWNIILRTGELIISGTGDMSDYSGGMTPWYNFREYADTAVIASGVSSVGDHAFANMEITGASLSDTVTSIGYGSFYGCSSLVQINIPKSLTSIGTDALKLCASLKRITVDKNNSVFSSDDGVLYNKDKTALLYYPVGRTGASFTVPGSVTHIGKDAFCSCNLSSVVLPAGLVSVGSGAFYASFKLDNITYLGTKKTWENVTKESAWDAYVGYDTADSTYTLLCTGAATVLYSGEFGNGLSWKLDENGLLTISGNGEMPDFVLDNFGSLGGGGSIEGLLPPWYDYRESILGVVVSNGITRIGCYAFYECINLESITLYKTVKSIGDSALGTCTSLAVINYYGNEKGWENVTKGAYWNSYAGADTAGGTYSVVIIPDDSITYGDATGDGIIDSKDLVRLKKYLAAYDYDTETSSVDISDGADATGDGIIDNKDLVRLKKYLANFDYDTGTSDIVLGPQ